MRLTIAGPRKWSSIQKRHPPAVYLTQQWILIQLDLITGRSNCEAVSGLQLGLDTNFASFCINKGIPLTVILSCKEQDKFWDESNKKTYRYLLSKAQQIEYGTDTYTKNCIPDQTQKINLWLTKAPATLFLVKYQSLSEDQKKRKIWAEQHNVEIKTHKVKP